MLLIITAVGYVCARLGYFDFHTKDKLTKLLMNMVLSCMIVTSAAGVDAAQIGSGAMLALALGVLQFFLLLACGYAFAAAFRATRAQRGTYIIMSTCTNTSFVGIPVAAAIFGDDVTIFCSVFIMAMNLLFFSMGIPLAAGSGGGGVATQTPWQRVVTGLRAAASPHDVCGAFGAGACGNGRAVARCGAGFHPDDWQHHGTACHAYMFAMPTGSMASMFAAASN